MASSNTGTDASNTVEMSKVFSKMDEMGDDATNAVLDTAHAANAFYTEWRQFALRKNVFDVTIGNVTSFFDSLSK
jgi:hypothetical protein